MNRMYILSPPMEQLLLFSALNLPVFSNLVRLLVLVAFVLLGTTPVVVARVILLVVTQVLGQCLSAVLFAGLVDHSSCHFGQSVIPCF